MKVNLDPTFNISNNKLSDSSRVLSTIVKGSLITKFPNTAQNRLDDVQKQTQALPFRHRELVKNTKGQLGTKGADKSADNIKTKRDQTNLTLRQAKKQ